MGLWFRSRGKFLRRQMLLQRLEDRIVLDASVNPVRQDQPVPGVRPRSWALVKKSWDSL